MPNACCSHYSPGINLITFYLPAFLSFSCSASVRILTAPMAPRASPKQSNAAAVLFTSTLIFLPSSSGIAAFRSTPSGLRQQNPTMHARILAKCPRHKKTHSNGPSNPTRQLLSIISTKCCSGDGEGRKDKGGGGGSRSKTKLCVTKLYVKAGV